MFGLGTLARVARELRQDLTAAQDRDPAARGLGRIEILLTYGGVQALLVHRIAHAAQEAGLPIVPHGLAYLGRMTTGVEIHPGARIGEALFIDHGAGVVIGSGAKLLGPIHVGAGSKIGANSVVIHDVPPNSTVVGNPGHPVRIEGKKPEGPDADWAHLPDPVADAIRALSERVRELETQLGEVTGREPSEPAEVRPFRPRGQDPAGG
jgi:serine O-acetyltransferase